MYHMSFSQPHQGCISFYQLRLSAVFKIFPLPFLAPSRHFPCLKYSLIFHTLNYLVYLNIRPCTHLRHFRTPWTGSARYCPTPRRTRWWKAGSPPCLSSFLSPCSHRRRNQTPPQSANRKSKYSEIPPWDHLGIKTTYWDDRRLNSSGILFQTKTTWE